MTNRQLKSIIQLVHLGLLILLTTTISCTDRKNSNNKFSRPIEEAYILNDLVDRHLSKLNEMAKSDFDSTALVVNLGLDSMAKLESFRPYWLNKITELKQFSSRDNDAVIEQISNLANEKGNIYFLSAVLKNEYEETIKIYFAIEELEKDTLISWTTNRSLTAYMMKAPLRRNPTYWTKDLK